MEGALPAHPPKVEEIVTVVRAAGDGAHDRPLRGLIVILWRAKLRISEALALTEGNLDPRRRSLRVRRVANVLGRSSARSLRAGHRR